jgi:hypothetical protein
MSAVNNNSVSVAQTMPMEVMEHGILSNLDIEDWCLLSRVCTIWNGMIQPLIRADWDRVLKEVKFGKEQWLKIQGVKDVGEEPELSLEQVGKLKKKLYGKCPFFNVIDPIQPHRFQSDKIKKAWQTHMLILLPETINGEPRTLNSIGKIFHFLREGDNNTIYEYIDGAENAEYRNKTAPKSYFALITKDVVPGSRVITYEKKEGLIEGKGYRGPTPNEAITSIVIMNLGPSQAKKDYFFGREGKFWTYTTTTEKDGVWRFVFGGVAPSGAHVSRPHGASALVGVAGVEEV